MQAYDYTQTWYHGSQQKLTTLRVGSSITQNRNVAKTILSRYDENRHAIKSGVINIIKDGEVQLHQVIRP